MRDNYRNYDRAPFLKPKTTQEYFYSEGLKGLTIAIDSAKKLWYLAADIRFQDGVIPGFIADPAHYTFDALNKARHAVRETIEVLSYNMNKLQYKVKRTKQSAEERRSKPRSDMVGIRERLTNLAHATPEQTKIVEQYMEKNKEGLVSDDWKSVRGNIDQERENLTRLQHNLTPIDYLEGELVHFLELLWPQCEYDETFTRMERLIDEMSE